MPILVPGPPVSAILASPVPVLDDIELGVRAATYLAFENAPWAYKFWWMTNAWWWDEASGSWVAETRPEILALPL